MMMKKRKKFKEMEEGGWDGLVECQRTFGCRNFLAVPLSGLLTYADFFSLC